MPRLFATVLCLAGLHAATAAATCNIRITILNESGSAHPVTIVTDSFQVRSRTFIPALPENNTFSDLSIRPWGPWRRARNGGWLDDRNNVRLQPGDQVSDIYRAAALCRDYRQVRGDVICRGGSLAGQTRRIEAGTFQAHQTNNQVTIRTRCQG